MPPQDAVKSPSGGLSGSAIALARSLHSPRARSSDLGPEQVRLINAGATDPRQCCRLHSCSPIQCRGRSRAPRPPDRSGRFFRRESRMKRHAHRTAGNRDCRNSRIRAARQHDGHAVPGSDSEPAQLGRRCPSFASRARRYSMPLLNDVRPGAKMAVCSGIVRQQCSRRSATEVSGYPALISGTDNSSRVFNMFRPKCSYSARTRGFAHTFRPFTGVRARLARTPRRDALAGFAH